jgi:hypothetical protein
MNSGIHRIRRVWQFMKLYSKNFSRLGNFYRVCFPNQPWFGSIILELVELGKRLSKVDYETPGRKKKRRCMKACCKIMFSMMLEYSRILKEKVVRFDNFVQRLYGFSQEMALLLCNITFDIVQDQHFEHLLSIASQCDLDLWGILFGKVKVTFYTFPNLLAIASQCKLDLWSVFSGKVEVTSFTFPENPSFYLNLVFAQCICARSNPRKRLLTTSGFVNMIVRKFDIQQIFPKRNPNDNRTLLFKSI